MLKLCRFNSLLSEEDLTVDVRASFCECRWSYKPSGNGIHVDSFLNKFKFSAAAKVALHRDLCLGKIFCAPPTK